jgi:hypothetical protein
MLKRWQNIYLSVFLSQAILGISGLFAPKAIANPSPETLSEQVQVNVAESSSQQLPIKAEENILNTPPQVSSVGTLSNVQTSLRELKTESNLPIPPLRFLTAQENNPDVTPAQPSSMTENPIEDSSRWHIKFQPYIPVPLSVYGTTTIGDRSLSFNSGLGGVLDALNFAIYGRFEAWNNNLGFIVDASYQSFGGYANSGRDFKRLQTDLSTSTNFSQGIYDFAISYHIGDPAQYSLPDKPSNKSFPQVWVEPIIGIRLNTLNTSIDADLDFTFRRQQFDRSFQRTVSRSRTWLEPMVGAKFGVQVSDPVTLWLRGDASGFGLAGTPDLQWNIITGADWWISPTTSLQIGYKFYEINYGNDDQSFEYGYNGPFLGVTFNF